MLYFLIKRFVGGFDRHRCSTIEDDLKSIVVNWNQRMLFFDFFRCLCWFLSFPYHNSICLTQTNIYWIAGGVPTGIRSIRTNICARTSRFVYFSDFSALSPRLTGSRRIAAPRKRNSALGTLFSRPAELVVQSTPVGRYPSEEHVLDLAEGQAGERCRIAQRHQQQ